jgi:hypothetical protein
MAEVVELVPKGAIERLSRKKKSGKFRLVALAKTQRLAAVEETVATVLDEQEKPTSTDAGPSDPGQAANAQTLEPETTRPAPLQSHPTSRLPLPVATSPAKAEDCFELFEIREGCLAVIWKLGKVDDWGAPVLGAACKEILGRKRIRQVVFDFTGVQEMSTGAVSTLIRFKNTIVHLEKTMCVVAGPGLRAQFAKAWVDRMIDVQDSVCRVVGTEVKFQERPVVRNRKRPWWKFFSMLLIVLLQTANAAGEGGFPSLAELERLLPEAPELQAIVLEIEQLRLESSWTRHINFHTSYSQHFASYVPVLSPSDRKISGDTLVLGVSASIALDELVQGRKKARLELRLKEVEYQRVYQAKLAALRVLCANRDRLREHMTATEAQAKTAELKLDRVRAGIPFDFLGFNAIDLAEAEEGVARLEVERRQTEIEIGSIETRILEVVGKGASGP